MNALTDLLIVPIPFLIKPLDLVIIHHVKLSGGDLFVALLPTPMRPCFVI